MSLDENQSDAEDDGPSSADDDLDSEDNEQIPDVDASDNVILDSNPTSRGASIEIGGAFVNNERPEPTPPSRRASIEIGGPLITHERPEPAAWCERDDRLLNAAQTLSGGDAESQPDGQGISPASVSYSSNLRFRSKEFDCVREAKTLTEKGGCSSHQSMYLPRQESKDAETVIEGGKTEQLLAAPPTDDGTPSDGYTRLSRLF